MLSFLRVVLYHDVRFNSPGCTAFSVILKLVHMHPFRYVFFFFFFWGGGGPAWDKLLGISVGYDFQS